MNSATSADTWSRQSSFGIIFLSWNISAGKPRDVGISLFALYSFGWVSPWSFCLTKLGSGRIGLATSLAGIWNRRRVGRGMTERFTGYIDVVLLIIVLAARWIGGRDQRWWMVRVSIADKAENTVMGQMFHHNISFDHRHAAGDDARVYAWTLLLMLLKDHNDDTIYSRLFCLTNTLICDTTIQNLLCRIVCTISRFSIAGLQSVDSVILRHHGQRYQEANCCRKRQSKGWR